METSTKKVLKIVGGILVGGAILATGFFIGRNMNNENSSSTSNEEVSALEEYIELGKYKGIEVDKKKLSLKDISDEDVEADINYRLEEFIEYKDVTNRPTKTGDQIQMDFEGEMNGEKLDELQGEAYELIIGEGSFVKEVEDKLVGLELNKKTEVKVKFPEDTELGPDYANQEVKFLIKVIKIQEASKKPELTDKFVKEKMEFQNISELKKSVKAELLQAEIEGSEEELYSNLMKKIMANSKLKEYPQEIYDEAYEGIKAQMEETASMFGMSFEEYLAFSGIKGDDIPKDWVEESILETGISKLIIAKENITIGTDEYKKLIEENLELFGIETVEEVQETYSEEELKDYFSSVKLKDFLLKESKINELPAKEYDKKYSSDENK